MPKLLHALLDEGEDLLSTLMATSILPEVLVHAFQDWENADSPHSGTDSCFVHATCAGTEYLHRFNDASAQIFMWDDSFRHAICLHFHSNN